MKYKNIGKTIGIINNNQNLVLKNGCVVDLDEHLVNHNTIIKSLIKRNLLISVESDNKVVADTNKNLVNNTNNNNFFKNKKKKKNIFPLSYPSVNEDNTGSIAEDNTEDKKDIATSSIDIIDVSQNHSEEIVQEISDSIDKVAIEEY